MATVARVPDSALYYPFINFRKQSWLKRAVLHWDVIWRIAPPGHEALDPPRYWESQPQDMHVLEQGDVVRKCETHGAEGVVANVWEELLSKHGDALAQQYAVDLDGREMLSDNTPDASGFLSSPTRRLRGVGWMYAPKMPAPLLDDFRRLGLLEDGHHRGAAGWAALDERVLDAYMTTLANAIIGTREMDTVADNPEHFRRFDENSVDALRDLLLPERRTDQSQAQAANGDDGAQMMALAIEAVQPGGLDVMSLDDVVAIRNGSADARHAFKQAVSGMVLELRGLRGGALDGKITKDELEDLRRRHIKEPLDELRKAMKWNTFDAVISVLTLKSPFEQGTLAAFLAGLVGGSGILVGAGVALGGVNAWRSARARKKELKKAPLAWLLDVERTLDARGALAKVV